MSERFIESGFHPDGVTPPRVRIPLSPPSNISVCRSLSTTASDLFLFGCFLLIVPKHTYHSRDFVLSSTTPCVFKDCILCIRIDHPDKNPHFQGNWQSLVMRESTELESETSRQLGVLVCEIPNMHPIDFLEAQPLVERSFVRVRYQHHIVITLEV